MLEPPTKYFNYNQQLIYQQITQKYSLTQKNSKALIKYYNHFNKLLDKHINHQTDYIKNLFQISVIFTQKSNFYQTIDGRRLPGISFSLNDILKKKNQCQMESFLDLIKEILTKTKFKDNTLKHQMQRLVIQIHCSLQEFLLFQKLFMIFYKTTVQQSYQSQFYKNKLLTCSWYLYIDAKYSLLEKRNQSIVIKKFIMISILQNIVLNSLEHIKPIILEKGSPKRVGMNSSQNKKQLIEKILSILLKQAQVSNNQILAYQDVTSAFDDYFDNLIQIAIIKSFSEDKFDYLCLKSLEINLRKLDRKINKQIKADEVDLRKFINFLQQEKDQKSHKRTAIQDKFIKNRKRNQENMKKKRQSILNDKQKVYKSHRVLNLDQFDLNNTSSSSILTEENEKQCNQINQINIAKQFIRDSTRLSIPFLHQVTQKDELSTFIQQKTRPYISSVQKYQQSTLQMIENIHQKINSILQGQKQNPIKIRLTNSDTLQTYEFYRYLTEQAWGDNKKGYFEQSNQHLQMYYNSSNKFRNANKNSIKNYILQQSYSSYQSLLIISISTIILNKYQKITIQTLNKLLLQSSDSKGLIQIDYINLFYTSIYIKQMLTIPNLMDKLISNITDFLINEYLWINQDFIEQLQYASEEIEQKSRQNISKDIQKQSIACIIQQIAEYVIKMTDKMIGRFGSSTNSSYFKQPLKIINPLQSSQLILNQSQNQKTQSYLAQWKSKTVSSCLTILIYLPDILHLHTLNQIILCTLYSTSKLLKLKIKFQDIIYVYKNYILKNNQQELQKTILNIRKNPNFTSATDCSYETHKDIIQFYNKQFIQYLSLCSCFNHQKKYLQWIQLLTNYKVEFDFCYQDQGLKKSQKRCYTSPNEIQGNPILLSPLIKRKKSPIYQFYQKNSEQKQYQPNKNYKNLNHKKTNSIYDSYDGQMNFEGKRFTNKRKNSEINIINLEQHQDQGQQNNLNYSQGQLGIYSSIQRPSFQAKQNNYHLQQNQSEKQNVLINGVTYTNQGQKKTININLQLLNNYNSRNPTRIKQRKTIQQMNQWLCYTKKAKHPIFTQLRDD